MSKPTLGQTAPPETIGLRDAFHVAGVVVTCREVVMPGDNLRVTGNVADVANWDNRNAIADPFLLPDVQPGVAFWALIVPEKVQSLSHTFKIDGEGSQEAKPALVADYDDGDHNDCRAMGCHK